MTDADRREHTLGDKLRYHENPDHLKAQLAHCAALDMPEALEWCELLDIPVRRVDPIGLVSKRALEKWAATSLMGRTAAVDEACACILDDDEHEQAIGWTLVERMADRGEVLGLILKNVAYGIYASEWLKRDTLAKEHVWPEVMAALDG